MSENALFTPLTLGKLTLKHRVIMAPLTRMRAQQPGDLAWSLHADYYGQRASEGGLLITEATNISPESVGYPWIPGVYSSAQVEGWRAVTDAVHAKGGYIFNQIWHTGRISHSSMQPGNALPVAPSAIAAKGDHMDASGNPVPFETPRALTLAEINTIKTDFVQAALNARLAGFDGVEVHGANGYLLDQFLRSNSNHRTDEYGGSIENRARLLLEVVDAIVSATDACFVGVRLSPWGTFNDMSNADGLDIWKYVLEQLSHRGLAYVHLIEPRADFTDDSGAQDNSAPDAAAELGAFYQGVVISAGGFKPDTAEQNVQAKRSSAIAFGRLFIANPDLPARIQAGAPMNKWDRSTFYGGGAEGYTDYAFLNTENV